MKYHITAGRVGTEFDIDRLHSIRVRFRRGAARPEPDNDAASHRHKTNDATAGALLHPNANTAPDEEHIERHANWFSANHCDAHVVDQTRSVPKHHSSTRPAA